jgi:hypothetical protein
MNFRGRLKYGLITGGIITFALVFLPPLFAHRLEAWVAAERLLPIEPKLVSVCGSDVKINLSRWFYTYRFSGEDADARFNGMVHSKTCEKDFVVQLKRNNHRWEINNISW